MLFLAGVATSQVVYDEDATQENIHEIRPQYDTFNRLNAQNERNEKVENALETLTKHDMSHHGFFKG